MFIHGRGVDVFGVDDFEDDGFYTRERTGERNCDGYDTGEWVAGSESSVDKLFRTESEKE